ncbi:MAG: hypothetical protein JO007_05075 [Alphaproteobacteria bacterium]|nr:hypothetical protein [Alphaproteobacteria bacterium]
MSELIGTLARLPGSLFPDPDQTAKITMLAGPLSGAGLVSRSGARLFLIPLVSLAGLGCTKSKQIVRDKARRSN